MAACTHLLHASCELIAPCTAHVWPDRSTLAKQHSAEEFFFRAYAHRVPLLRQRLRRSTPRSASTAGCRASRRLTLASAGCHRRPRWIVFTVVARDCTDNAASPPIFPSSSPWRVHRRRRSDQQIARTSAPSTSPSTRLPPIEHRVATAPPLRAAAPPPLVRATGCQCALPGVYAPVASRRCPESRPAATPPLGPLRRRT